jgi:putative IMPACT (imprinted ancient) family translation regulator
LVHAYSNSAKTVLELANIQPFVQWVAVPLVLDYKQLPALEYTLKKLEGRIVNQEFAGQVKLLVQLPASQQASLLLAFPQV